MLWFSFRNSGVVGVEVESGVPLVLEHLSERALLKILFLSSWNIGNRN